jgi:ABC-type antimicrobial peptide transport system permease subunit
VGVAASAANRGLDRAPEPEVYTSFAQDAGGWNQLFVLARTAGDPRALVPDVRAIVRALDPEQSVYAVQTVEQAFAALALPRRIATGLVGGFATFALALALSGIYSVVAFAAAARTREIGLRMAVGAGAGEVRSLVVRQALPPVLAGVAAGVAGAVAASRPLQAVLFEVQGTDPLTLGIVATLFASTALLAAYGPARRASRLDPVRALRSE